MAAVGVSDDSS